jgi:hypothetical protein
MAVGRERKIDMTIGDRIEDRGSKEAGASDEQAQDTGMHPGIAPGTDKAVKSKFRLRCGVWIWTLEGATKKTIRWQKGG